MMNYYKTVVEIYITTQQLLHYFMHGKHQISSKEAALLILGIQNEIRILTYFLK